MFTFYDREKTDREEAALEYLTRKGAEREEGIRALKVGVIICFLIIFVLSVLVGVGLIW